MLLRRARWPPVLVHVDGVPAGMVTRRLGRANHPFRYALDLSYVLSASPQIEPITEEVPDQIPLGEAQRIDRQAYESPALPLSYSAVVIKLT
jgi:hypothetical protein